MPRSDIRAGPAHSVSRGGIHSLIGFRVRVAGSGRDSGPIKIQIDRPSDHPDRFFIWFVHEHLIFQITENVMLVQIERHVVVVIGLDALTKRHQSHRNHVVRLPEKRHQPACCVEPLIIFRAVHNVVDETRQLIASVTQAHAELISDQRQSRARVYIPPSIFGALYAGYAAAETKLIRAQVRIERDIFY